MLLKVLEHINIMLLKTLAIFVILGVIGTLGKPKVSIEDLKNVNAEKPRLRFDTNGKFKIVNFADLHYGEFPGTQVGRAQDGNSSRVMKDILEFEHPDFVVFTGDFITGEGIFINGTGFIQTILAPLAEANYRWASTYGNHDNGVTVTREAIFATEQRYDQSYTQHGAPGLAGLTNYYLPVYANEEQAGESPVLILWFFDSQGGFDPSGIKPTFVDETVVQWFIQTNRNITAEWGAIPALAFFHIPTLDYREVQANMPADCAGLVAEAVVPQHRNTSFMEALVASGTVLTTFVGHDHGNAWCCPYRGMEICYNRHTGYGGYGSWTRGARVIDLELGETKSLSKRTNYIRLENGTIIDRYPKDEFLQ